jgi:hypothetical protein
LCFWGSSSNNDSQQQVSAPPAPSPAPTMQNPTPENSAGQTRNKIAALRYGMMSTIRNVGGASGITGTGGDLNNTNQQGKKTLGS